MLKKLRYAFLFVSLEILLFALSANAGTQYQVNCQNFSAPLKGGFCVHSPVPRQSNTVLYHFHGNGGNETNWQEKFYYPEQIRTEWDKRQLPAPTVISVSFGPAWVLAEKNSSPDSGLFELFTGRVLPQIEQGLGFRIRKRMIVGESMGGINTIQLAFKTRLFERAAILCAPMGDVPYGATDADIQHFVENTAAYKYYQNYDPTRVIKAIREILGLREHFFPTPAEWQSADPLEFAKNSPTGRKRLYITAGYYDQFALYETNEKWAADLKAQGHKITWRPQWGGHCVMDIKSLAGFLQ